MAPQERIAEEYAAKEARKGNFIPLVVFHTVLVVLFIGTMMAKRHFLKKYAKGKRLTSKVVGDVYRRHKMLVTDLSVYAILPVLKPNRI